MTDLLIFLPLHLGLLAVGGGWLLFRKLYGTAVVVAFLLTLHGVALLKQGQQFRHLVKTAIDTQDVVHVEGEVAGHQLVGEGVRLHLQRVRIAGGGRESAELTELALLLPKRGRMRLYRGRSLHVDGTPSAQGRFENLPELRFHRAFLRQAQPLSRDWQARRDSWVSRLQARAAFYLEPETLSIFLPLTLAQRGYPSESQRLFRNTGLAHLLAISGLHMAMLYGLLVTLFRKLGGLRLKWLASPHFPNACRGMALLGLWGYLVLLGFPTPALRAVVMLTALVSAWITGRAWATLYVLAATAAGFVLLDPSSLHDLSFQLSFLAVLYILLFLPLSYSPSTAFGFPARARRFLGVSLLMTTAATLGTGPIIATAFQRVPLEAFWLNLIMVPLLGLVILPVCLTVALLSALHLGAMPFGGLEHLGYGLAELVLEAWLGILRTLHGWGAWATLEVQLDWTPVHFLAYYAVTVLGGWGVMRWRQGRRNREAR